MLTFPELYDFLDKNDLSDLKQTMIKEELTLPLLLSLDSLDMLPFLKLGSKLKLNEALKKYKGLYEIDTAYC